jgi:hypothetical protein
MEDNLEIHLEEVHLEDHHLIHLLDLMDAQHLTRTCLTTMVSTTYYITYSRINNQATL